MIKVQCECGRVLRTKDENAGKHVNCPECGEELRLPVPRSMRRQSSSEPAMPARRSGRTTPKAKKSKEAPEATPAGSGGLDKNMKYLLAMAGVVGVGLLTVVIVWIVKSTGPNTSTVGLPKNFIPFEFAAGQFVCDQPEGWTPMYGGGSGNKPPFAKFMDEENDITIEIRAGVAGSVISDMLNQPADGEQPDPLERVQALHLFRQTQLSSSAGDYKESDPEVVETKGFGPSLMSPYERADLLQKDFGYRATVITANFQYNVTLYCPERDMQRYKPTFVRVLTSMAPPGLEDGRPPGQ